MKVIIEFSRAADSTQQWVVYLKGHKGHAKTFTTLFGMRHYVGRLYARNAANAGHGLGVAVAA